MPATRPGPQIDPERLVDEHTVDALCTVGPDDVAPADRLTYARNVFVPLTTACRYTCTYCTFYDPPGQATLLDEDEIRDICRQGAQAGCTEALFTFGDDPDERYGDLHGTLESWGYDSIHDYLRRACEIALDEGLLPHANPGDQTRAELAAVADVNASMGVMLETTARIRAHDGPRGKVPARRLGTIDLAGEMGMPFTTGILVGIGEDWRDRARSLAAIAALHERHGHVQEVIVQPVRENDRWSGATPNSETMRRVVAMARVALPEDVSVQVPPNLLPAEELLDCGIDDLGGVSPVTDDHVNPEHSWPAVDRLEAIADAGGVPLDERLPVHGRYVDSEWLADPILDAIEREDTAGERFREILGRD